MVNFAILEVELRIALGMLLYPPSSQDIVVNAGRVLVLTANLTFRQQVQAFRSLHQLLHGDSSKDTLMSLCRRLQEAGQRRNQLIHSRWKGNRDATGEAIRVKATGEPRPEMWWQVETLTASQINQFADDLLELAGDLELFARQEPTRPKAMA